MGKIVLYYKYIAVPKPSEEVAAQKKLCASLGLTGRIFIAQEGINGTVAGSVEAVEKYKEAMEFHPLFAGIDYKESPGATACFPRLQVTAKAQIVNFGIDPAEVSASDAGIYLTPEEAHRLISENSENLLLFDARNDYESRIGTFSGAVTPAIENFRDLPGYIDAHTEQFENKQVIMFCTGGIRCERATAYLKKKNVAEKVFHIKGGIHKYIEAFPDGYFRGKNYVFDGRISQKVTDDILATCDHCHKPNDEYTNCINAQCNRQVIVCESCIDSYHNSCGDTCAELVRTHKVPLRVLPRKITASELEN